jgi:hypothetical protein
MGRVSISGGAERVNARQDIDRLANDHMESECAIRLGNHLTFDLTMSFPDGSDGGAGVLARAVF